MPLLRFDGKLNASVWDGQNNQIILGRFHATDAGSAIPLNPNRTWAIRGNADDGGKIMTGTGAAYLFSSRRMLLTAVQTGNNSFFGGCDRLSIAADESSIGAEIAASWGMLEIKSGGKTPANSAGCSCYRADLNIASGSTISTNSIVSAFLSAAEKLSASTHNGRYTIMHVPNPQAGTYDSFLELGSATGVSVSHATPGADSGLELHVYINGSPYAIRLLAVGSG